MGKKQQVVYLNSGYTHDPAKIKHRRETLLFKMGELLEANNNTLPVSKIGEDATIREIRKNSPATLSQFIRKHPEYFSVEESEQTTDKGPKKVSVVTLVSKPPEPEPLPETPEPDPNDLSAQFPNWVPPNMIAAYKEWWNSWSEDGKDAAAQDAAALQAESVLADALA